MKQPDWQPGMTKIMPEQALELLVRSILEKLPSDLRMRLTKETIGELLNDVQDKRINVLYYADGSVEFILADANTEAPTPPTIH